MKKCQYCYYYDLCKSKRICRYYDPIANIDEFEDENIVSIIEQDKKEFLHDWNIYIKQYEID